MDEIENKLHYCYVAPDGTCQLGTLSEDPVVVVAFAKMLYKSGMGMSPHELKLKGFKVQPVMLTVKNLTYGDDPNATT